MWHGCRALCVLTSIWGHPSSAVDCECIEAVSPALTGCPRRTNKRVFGGELGLPIRRNVNGRDPSVQGGQCIHHWESFIGAFTQAVGWRGGAVNLMEWFVTFIYDALRDKIMHL